MIQRLKNWLFDHMMSLLFDRSSTRQASIVVPNGLRDEKVIVSKMRRGYNKVTVDFLLPIKPKDAKPHRKNRRN